MLYGKICGSRRPHLGPKESFCREATFKLSRGYSDKAKREVQAGDTAWAKALRLARVLAWYLVQRKRPFVKCAEGTNYLFGSQCTERDVY